MERPSLSHLFCIIYKSSSTFIFNDNLTIGRSLFSYQAAEMEERIRRKRELQKKAATPATFKESLSKEKGKQAELSKSKEERRQALCEELGRGCWVQERNLL